MGILLWAQAVTGFLLWGLGLAILFLGLVSSTTGCPGPLGTGGANCLPPWLQGDVALLLGLTLVAVALGLTSRLPRHWARGRSSGGGVGTEEGFVHPLPGGLGVWVPRSSVPSGLLRGTTPSPAPSTHASLGGALHLGTGHVVPRGVTPRSSPRPTFSVRAVVPRAPPVGAGKTGGRATSVQSERSRLRFAPYSPARGRVFPLPGGLGIVVPTSRAPLRSRTYPPYGPLGPVPARARVRAGGAARPSVRRDPDRPRKGSSPGPSKMSGRSRPSQRPDGP